MVRGVNLGGWFVLEAWMMPDFFDATLQNLNITDQYTLMTNANASFAQSKLLNHWQTWITETDFQQIAAAGLNTVRIPVPHWAFNGSTAEPYWAYAEQPYIKQALLWASKYSLDVIIDMHTAPNSQNGFDNSGRAGPIQFANVSAKHNSKRLISALTTVVNLYVNDASYNGVVKGIEILNEPACYALGQTYMNAIHLAAFTAIRAAVKTNALVFPTTIIHDCFVSPLSQWYSVYNSKSTPIINGSYAIDTHRYQAFAPLSTTLTTDDQHVNYACGLSAELSDAQTNDFPVIVGEWSLNAYPSGPYNNISQSVAGQNSPAQNLFLRRFFEAQVTTYEKAGGWIFWSWKTASSATWSYQAALAQGWIPANPTTRVFAQTNGCPTNVTTQTVTFATQNNTAAAVSASAGGAAVPQLVPSATNVTTVLNNDTLSHSTTDINATTTTSKKRRALFPLTAFFAKE
ncbi:hypothetical protein CBS101457_005170 [Exobasidium rhododendri]|nr:hypothetical protein CBS101457_005170 [Exobasidium rhododendri]